MVKCQRCGGFMVRDSIYNIEGQYLEIEVGRCLNCGHTIDLTLLKLRHTHTKKSGIQPQDVESKNDKVLV